MNIVHHLVFHIEALLIGSRVENSLHAETGTRRRCADEIDDSFEIPQGLATPVETDE
jgi:hypothetical protein